MGGEYWLLIGILAVTALVLWRAEITALVVRAVRPRRPPQLPEMGTRAFGGGGSVEPEAPDYWPQEYLPRYYWPISYWPRVGTNIVGPVVVAAATDERPHIRMDTRHRRGR